MFGLLGNEPDERIAPRLNQSDEVDGQLLMVVATAVECIGDHLFIDFSQPLLLALPIPDRNIGNIGQYLRQVLCRQCARGSLAQLGTFECGAHQVDQAACLLAAVD